jgi:hypothetical protein
MLPTALELKKAMEKQATYRIILQSFLPAASYLETQPLNVV